MLEDSIRLSRIRRIKHWLYVVQAAMLVLLGIALIVIFGGAKVKPYVYIPMDSFLAVLALLLLIISLESFFFRMLEIKFARSSSARHLMAKNSMKRAIISAAVAGAVCAVLILPPILTAIEDSAERTLDLSPNAPTPFYSGDAFDLISSVRVEIGASEQVEVYLMDDEVFNKYYSGFPTPEFLVEMYSYRLNTDDYVVDPGMALVIRVPNQGFMLYHLVLNDFGYGVSARATIMKEVSQTLTELTSLLLLSLVVANIAWFAYLVPIERKYSSGSIYK
ncbi:MAG: hypothetical protein JW880_06205 [Candidatus Thermoplasmatota archaeon]|nr:hypothetical protein [Candidatus Thermoplasmatota archaeon]